MYRYPLLRFPADVCSHIIAQGGLALASFEEFRRLVASEDEAVEFEESDNEASAPAAVRVLRDEAIVVPDAEIAASPSQVVLEGDSIPPPTGRESVISVVDSETGASEAGASEAGLVATMELFGAAQTKLQCSVDKISSDVAEVQRGIQSLRQELEQVHAIFREGFKALEDLKGSLAALKGSFTAPPTSAAPVVSDDPFVDDSAPPAKRSRSSRGSVGSVASAARLLLTQFQVIVLRQKYPCIPPFPPESSN